MGLTREERNAYRTLNVLRSINYLLADLNEHLGFVQTNTSRKLSKRVARTSQLVSIEMVKLLNELDRVRMKGR